MREWERYISKTGRKHFADEFDAFFYEILDG